MAKKKNTPAKNADEPILEKIAGKLGHLTGEIIAAKDHLVDMASGAADTVKEKIQSITQKTPPAKKTVKAAVKKVKKAVAKKAAPAKKAVKAAVKKATKKSSPVKKAAKKVIKKAAPVKKAAKAIVKKAAKKVSRKK